MGSNGLEGLKTRCWSGQNVIGSFKKYNVVLYHPNAEATASGTKM